MKKHFFLLVMAVLAIKSTAKSPGEAAQQVKALVEGKTKEASKGFFRMSNNQASRDILKGVVLGIAPRFATTALPKARKDNGIPSSIKAGIGLLSWGFLFGGTREPKTPLNYRDCLVAGVSIISFCASFHIMPAHGDGAVGPDFG